MSTTIIWIKKYIYDASSSDNDASIISKNWNAIIILSHQGTYLSHSTCPFYFSPWMLLCLVLQYFLTLDCNIKHPWCFHYDLHSTENNGGQWSQCSRRKAIEWRRKEFWGYSRRQHYVNATTRWMKPKRYKFLASLISRQQSTCTGDNLKLIQNNDAI